MMMMIENIRCAEHFRKHLVKTGLCQELTVSTGQMQSKWRMSWNWSVNEKRRDLKERFPGGDGGYLVFVKQKAVLVEREGGMKQENLSFSLLIIKRHFLVIFTYRFSIYFCVLQWVLATGCQVSFTPSKSSKLYKMVTLPYLRLFLVLNILLWVGLNLI